MQVTQPTFSAADSLLLSLGLPLAGESLAPAQVVGFGAVPIVTRTPCSRAVELPELVALSLKTNVLSGFSAGPDTTTTASGAEAAKIALQLASANRWLRFEIGASQRIRMVVAMNGALFKEMQATANQSWVSIIELDVNGSAVATHPILSLAPKIVNSANDTTVLPANWTSATSPWSRDVASMLGFLFQQTTEVILFFEFIPSPKMVTIEVATTAPANFKAAIMVGAAESCPTGETIRYNNQVAIQQSTVEAISSYLDGGSPVPLLAPDTVYTVTVNYDVIATNSGSTGSPSSRSQAYQFRTDNKPPALLSSYVLCSSPVQNETFVFYEDPLDVIFNDRSVFSLFEAYGYQLTFDLHAADGLPEGSPAGAFLTGSPSPLQMINGVGQAMYDSMLQAGTEPAMPQW